MVGRSLGRRPETLAAVSAVGVWQVDASTGLASLDVDAAAMMKVDGYSADQLIPLAEVMSRIRADDRDLVREVHSAVTRDGGPVLTEFRVVDGSGGIRWIQCRGQYALSEEGVMTGRGVMVDVTDIHAWSGPIPAQAAVPLARQKQATVRTPAVPSDPLADAAELAVELRKALGRTGHGALRLAADLLLWEINTAIAERHVISDKPVPGVSPPSR